MEPLSDDWLRLIVKALPQFLWTAGANGVPTYLDPRFVALLGVTDQAHAIQGWFESIHAEDREETIVGWRNAVTEGREFRLEYRMHVADRSVRWFAVMARPVRDDDGKPTYWVGTIEDISEIIKTRTALRAEQVRLAKMADASPQMLYSFRIGPEGRPCFPYIGPVFARTFKVDPDELALDAASFFRLGNEEDGPAVGASVQVSLQTMKLWQHQWRVTAPGKGEIWIEAHAMPVRDADGGTTWHGTVSDITERRQYEDDIRKLNAELEQRVARRTEELEAANRELEAFSYSVSHDLREPLRAVNGFSQAVVEDYGALLPEDAKRYLDAIRQGGLRMGRLIDDLLAFSRLSRQPIRRRAIDVKEIVADCLNELSANVSSKAEVRVGELLSCEADPALAKQVFINLLGNAFKYSRKRDLPQIEVTSLRNEQGHVVYSVRDNGTGFDMKYAGKLFQVFQRLHRPTEFEGTGVGLAVVHRIVVRHGGRVWVDAAPDAGAKFEFTLEG